MSTEFFIGLMSGTSIDGIDCSIIALNGAAVEVVATHYEEWPTKLRKDIFTLCDGTNISLELLGKTDVAIGKLFASIVKRTIQKTEIDPGAVKAIGSHGQTIWHQPTGNNPFTMQIGDPNIISQQTGITTVSAFRQKDIASGGQGAPLAPLFHQEFFHDTKCDRTIVNIGGIANITMLARRGACSAYDIGPGNVLLDYWNYKERGTRFDKNGSWAASGQYSDELLNKMRTEPYLEQSPPKSTGRELFNGAWLEEKISQCSESIQPNNVQATLCEFTSRNIADAIINFSTDAEVYICGGGAHNSLLMENLSSKLGRNVATTSDLGIGPDWVESAAFAWMAKQTINGEKLETSPFTGARKPSILGGIYLSD